MQTSNRISQTAPGYWRIVLALASKDIVDALKNKTTFTMLIGLFFVMLTAQALPIVLKLDNRPRVGIFDAAQSDVADVLRREGVAQIYELRSQDQAMSLAQESSAPLVAVTLPEDWPESEGPLLVEGYMVHWIRPQPAADLIARSEALLTAVTNRPVTIQRQSVYPTPESGGRIVMVSLGLVIVITMITAILVPYLLLEEKTAHTLDVLRVSPASVSQIIWGKGLAGMVYGILAAAVFLSFNIWMVNQWGVMVLAIVTGTLFGVMVGLLIGIITENEGTMQMWLGLLMVLFVFPSLIGSFASGRLPEWVLSLLNWLPTSAMFSLIRLSFSNAWQPGQIALNVAIIFVGALLFFGLTIWRLSRWE